MKYLYYPGCSLEGTAKEYDISTRAVMEHMGVELTEIPDWNCCGASAVESVSEMLTYTLPARNLALAEKEMPGGDILIACNACYLNLLRVQLKVLPDRRLLDQVNEVLGEEGLSYTGKCKPRHLLDILLNDIGMERVKEKVLHDLEGLIFAPYYGCHILRPYPMFDDPEFPTSMEPVLKVLGARIHPWSMGGKCCAASLMTTHKEVSLKAVASILNAARGADAIVTSCPFCQMNLESYQKDASRMLGKELSFSVIYLTQLIGLAFGLSEEDVALGMNIIITDTLGDKFKMWREAAA